MNVSKTTIVVEAILGEYYSGDCTSCYEAFEDKATPEEIHQVLIDNTELIDNFNLPGLIEKEIINKVC